MLKEIDFIWKATKELPKPPILDWKVGAFIIDQEVVDINIYSNSFCDIVSLSNISENEPQHNNGDYSINLINKETQEVIQIIVNERLGAIMLSNPIFVIVPQETPWVDLGSKYIDNQFRR